MDNDTTQPAENTVSGSLQGTNAAQAGSVPAAVEPEPSAGTYDAERAEADARQADPVIRAWVRQNLSWLMAELDHGRQGRTAEERTGLNP